MTQHRAGDRPLSRPSDAGEYSQARDLEPLLAEDSLPKRKSPDRDQPAMIEVDRLDMEHRADSIRACREHILHLEGLGS
jgi:hypothetical protein